MKAHCIDIGNNLLFRDFNKGKKGRESTDSTIDIIIFDIKPVITVTNIKVFLFKLPGGY